MDWVLAGIAVLAGLGAIRMARIWFRYRGARVVTCPENQRPAGVSLDSLHASLTAPGRPAALRLSTCSRWLGLRADSRRRSVIPITALIGVRIS